MAGRISIEASEVQKKWQCVPSACCVAVLTLSTLPPPPPPPPIPRAPSRSSQMTRTGSLIDLLTVFAGGSASGPGPGQPGGPSIHQAPRLTVSKPARQEAGALLSAMCSDSKFGPPCVMALSQLIPEALVMSIKDSVSAATSAGAGGAMVGAAGTGAGAAGAGSTPGGLGDSVLVFDGDHETPELIWDGTCRHDLRCTLGQMVAGLSRFRQRAADSGQPGGADGALWSLPANFRLPYKALEGELKVGGVYVRLFLKEPTYPLRNPQVCCTGHCWVWERVC